MKVVATAILLSTRGTADSDRWYHALGREASGAKLPSEGLRLNASKSESQPVRGNDAAGAPASRAARAQRLPVYAMGGRAEPRATLALTGRPSRRPGAPIAEPTPPLREGRQITCRRLGYGSGCRAQ